MIQALLWVVGNDLNRVVAPKAVRSGEGGVVRRMRVEQTTNDQVEVGPIAIGQVEIEAAIPFHGGEAGAPSLQQLQGDWHSWDIT